MSKYDKAGLAMIPSGYKASKVYSVIPNSTDGDFDFSRSGSATRVNKDGLIEVVGSNVPRLDYPFIDGVVQDTPSLLLEPSRTNEQVYSEEFDNAAWGKTNVTVTANSAISPDGSQNADMISETSDTGLHTLADGYSFVSGTSYVFSCFAKKGTSKYFRLSAGNPATMPISSIFDLEDGTILTSLGGSTSTIKKYSNGWYRCSVVATASATASTNFLLGLSDGLTTSYTGNTSNNIYLWGAQLEAGSYPTSYIPTSGSAVTRNAEVCNGAGTSADFNDSEGVLFAEISALADDGTSRRISISDDSGTDFFHIVSIEFDETSSTLKVFISNGSIIDSYTYSNFNQKQSNKIAFKYNSTSADLYVNGFEVGAISSPSLPTGLVALDFDSGRSDEIHPFYGNTKQLITFKEALTDAELEELTSWQSFNEMAEAQEYKTY